jgi:hypothetical protein
MITVERMIQKVRPGKWAELEEIDKKYNAVERRLGYPPKKRYQCVMGGHDLNTVITERQWDSLAAMEAAYEKAAADPEFSALNEEGASIFKSTQMEVYMPLP